MNVLPAMTAWVVLMMLAGCAARTPAPIEERDLTGRGAGRATGAVTGNLAGERRHQGGPHQSQVEVFGLTAPTGLQLIEQARTAEQLGRFNEAARIVRQALELSPQDPEYWQYLAELELQGGDFLAAIGNAARSFELGTQTGPLCYRNWLTKQHAHEALGDVPNATAAKQQAEQCLQASDQAI